MVHERMAKREAAATSYTLILASRFVVKAEGTGVDFGTLKSGVGTLELAKLEALKDKGVATS